MDPARRAQVEAHLAGCSSCADYARVVERGIAELNALPPIEPSDDFIPRLQYRLYALEDGYGHPADHGSRSGASLGFVVSMVLLIGVAAWIPMVTPKHAEVQLPAAVAIAPARTDTLHSLFRSGPLLAPPAEAGLMANHGNATLFSRYAPLRAQTYQTISIRPR